MRSRIFIAKFDPDAGVPPLPWLTLTLKRNSWAALRRARLAGERECADNRGEGDPDARRGIDLDTYFPDPRGVDPEQQLEHDERVDEVRAVLERLKPAERECLALKAAGYSYAEISEIKGWSATKVGRLMVEGRARLRDLSG